MRPRVRTLWTAMVVLGAVWVSAVSSVAATPPTIRADLEGRPIAPAEVGEWYCHDFSYPAIHCFTSEAELDAAVSALGYEPLVGGGRAGSSAGGSTVSPAGVLSLNYVHVYVDANYAGYSAYFSANYPDLGLIGWDDRISSFVALNSLAGEFRDLVNYGGFNYGFCCNSQVYYVGDAYNDRFSSVRHT
jgi:hypothetical protein